MDNFDEDALFSNDVVFLMNQIDTLSDQLNTDGDQESDKEEGYTFHYEDEDFGQYKMIHPADIDDL